MPLDNLQELSQERLCNRCRGRLFASVGHGLSNIERGSYIEYSLESFGYEVLRVPEKDCIICAGIFSEIQDYANEIVKRLEEYEYNSFLIGTTLSRDILEKEKLLQAKYGDKGESIKKEINREIGKMLGTVLGKDFDKADPDIMIKIDLTYMSIEFQIKSLYVYGTYRKLRRDMPQTRWIKYSEIKDTVESIMGNVAMEMAGGTNYFLHGAGREDVDVRMLGNGREFILEIANPKKRRIDLRILKERINSENRGIEVDNLRFAKKDEIVRIKDERYVKKYRALLESIDGKKIDMEELKRAIEQLNGKVIYQRTPLRVSASRSDLVRQRVIKSLYLESEEPPVIVIEAEAGTYIKELVSGDDGRTNPSLSDLVGQKIKIRELDVIEIER
ncbi:tRNA pseudouridine(54/55) synthase Pus10 [Cuniculiplasma sp. SKW3]|uniref:tRNA pseudouridine(54/55) synthase Pus10 n=1 Tax=Cuniculiplasma sp. SKW3 TaxID=3400170 RepID=UPI003FD45D85